MRLFLSFLLFVVVVNGQVALSIGDPVNLRPLTSTEVEFSGAFYETFEGAGYLTSGWVESGTTLPNEDSTTVVLQGSQSLRLTDGGTDAKTTNTFTGSTDIWMSWQDNFVNYATGTRDGIALYNSGGTRFFWYRLDGGGSSQRGVFIFSGLQLSGTLGDWPTNSNTKVWVHIQAGTTPGVSTDAILDVWWMTNAISTTTRPATTNLTYNAFTAVTSTGTLGLQLVGEQVITDRDNIRITTDGTSIDD